MKSNRYGSLIRQYRIKEKITQTDLAQKLSVSVSAVSKWENGTNEPDLEMLIKIASLLQIPSDQLFRKKEESSNTRFGLEQESFDEVPKPSFGEKTKLLLKFCLITCFLFLVFSVIFIFLKGNSSPSEPTSSADTGSEMYEVAFRRTTDEITQQIVWEAAVFYHNIPLEEIHADSPFIYTFSDQWNLDNTVPEEISIKKLSFYEDMENALNWGVPDISVYLYRLHRED